MSTCKTGAQPQEGLRLPPATRRRRPPATAIAAGGGCHAGPMVQRGRLGRLGAEMPHPAVPNACCRGRKCHEWRSSPSSLCCYRRAGAGMHASRGPGLRNDAWPMSVARNSGQDRHSLQDRCGCRQHSPGATSGGSASEGYLFQQQVLPPAAIRQDTDLRASTRVRGCNGGAACRLPPAAQASPPCVHRLPSAPLRRACVPSVCRRMQEQAAQPFAFRG